MKFFCLVLLLLTTRTYAETVMGRVVFIRKTSKTPYAVVDAGVNKGFTVGKTICFFDSDDTKLFCQKIVKARPRAASVRLTLEQTNILSPDMRAFLEGQSPEKEEFESDTEAVKNSDAEKIVEESEPEVILPPSRLKLSYVYTMISPIAYNSTKFDATQVGSSTGTVWASGEAVRSSLLGFEFSWHKFFKPTWTWGLGIGYSFFPKKKSSFDYDPTNSKASILTSVVGHLYSLNIPVIKHMELSSGWNVEMGPGLAILRSQVKHAALVTDDAAGTSTDVASVTSTLHAAAVTGNAAIVKVFGAWNASADIKILIPVVEFMKSSSGDSTANGSGADASVDSLKTALAHKKNAFGAQILLSVGRPL